MLESYRTPYRAALLIALILATTTYSSRHSSIASAPNSSLTCVGTKSWIVGTGFWQDAANWSGGTLPGPSDDACIPAGVTVTLSSGIHNIHSLGSNGTLVFSGGSLTVAGSLNSDGAVTISGGATLALGAASSINNTLTLNSGTLTGSSSLDVSGLFTSTAGTLSGPGTTNANGGMSISEATLGLDARTLNNNGPATFTNAAISMANGAVFNNSVGSTFDAQGFTLVILNGGVLPAFNNAGTFRKTAGGNTTFDAVPFNNSGTVDVQSGALQLNGGGTHTGPFTGAAGTTLSLGSFSGAGHTFTATATVTAANVSTVNTPPAYTINIASTYNVTNSTNVGFPSTLNLKGPITNMGSTLTVNGGTANINSSPATPPSTITVAGGLANFDFSGGINVSTINFSGGTISGPTTMTVSGLFTSTAGTLSGTGTTNANGGMSISEATLGLDARTLYNNGPATFTNAALSMANGAVFNNSVGSTFDAQGATLVIVNDGALPAFNNAGTFRKLAGAGGTTFDTVPLNNTGTVEIQTGTLSFTFGAPYTQSAGSTILNGGNISTNTTLNIQGGTLSGAGTITGDVSNGGTVAPGAFPGPSAGIINITGNYSQQSTGSLNIEIGGNTPDTFDQVTVGDNATLMTASPGSALNLHLINGFVPDLGNQFQVMSYSSITGSFARLNGLMIDKCETFKEMYGLTSLTLTVIDPEPPTLKNCPSMIIRVTDPNSCTAVVAYPLPGADDNCSGVGTPTCTPASGSAFPTGQTTVSCEVRDASNNSARCSFTVLVRDVQAPSITCPSPITRPAALGQCSAVVTYSSATAMDNCPGVGTPSCVPASGSTFQKGVTTVTCAVSDASNNPASCAFTVTINDTQAPVITCPANVTHGTDPNVCTAVVTYPNAIATDNCPGVGSPACTPASGSTFPKGVTTVTCVVNDATTNSATCRFTVTVNDSQAATTGGPQTICALSTTAPLGGNTPAGGATGTWTIVTGGATGRFNPNANTPGATFTHTGGSGTITLRWTVSNPPCPNTTADVVLTIKQPPTTATAGANQRIAPGSTTAPLGGNTPASGTGMWTIVTGGAGTFNPNASTPNATWTHVAGSGQVKLRWTISNPPCPNSFAEVTIQIGVPPTITCPASPIVANAAPGQCSASVFSTVTATGIPTPTIVCKLGATVITSPHMFPVGSTIVTCTDSNGVAPDASCSFTVMVNDTQPPAFPNGCPAGITKAAQATCPFTTSLLVTYTTPSATDNCGPAPTDVCTPPSGSTFPLGTTVVTCTAIDSSGNMARCSFPVNVYSFCLQDDSNSGNVVFVNAVTGDYLFCQNGLPLASGTGTLVVHGCNFQIDHTKGDRKVHIQGDTSANSGTGSGTAYIQKIGGGFLVQITDKKMSNNACTCQ